MNPANVPPVRLFKDVGRDRSPATADQVFRLRELLREEEVDAAAFFGDGFTSVEELSNWSASWGIEVLDSRWQVAWMEEQRQLILEAEERDLKRNMGIILRERFRRG